MRFFWIRIVRVWRVVGTAYSRLRLRLSTKITLSLDAGSCWRLGLWLLAASVLLKRVSVSHTARACAAMYAIAPLCTS